VSTGPIDLSGEIDRLYALAPDEFIAARNALAGRLRTAGAREAADTVRALARPSLAAWAVNQAARRRPDDVTDLLAAGAALRAAQEELLRGGEASALQDATRAERAALAEVLEEARAVLAEAGRGGQQTVERVRETLRAAAVDPDARDLLRTGRLSPEIRPSGLGLFEAAPPAAPASGREARPRKGGTASATPDPLARRRGLRDAQRDLEAARSRLAEREQAAAAARRMIEQAEEAREAASEALEDRRRAREEAERALAAARKAVERAQRAETVAAAERDRADAAVGRAQAEADRAERERVEAEERVVEVEAGARRLLDDEP
jgi:hypothetical protein